MSLDGLQAIHLAGAGLRSGFLPRIVVSLRPPAVCDGGAAAAALQVRGPQGCWAT